MSDKRQVNYFTECLRFDNDESVELSNLRAELEHLISQNIEECLNAQKVSSSFGVFKMKKIRDKICQNVAREAEKKIVQDHLYDSVKY